MFKNYLTIAFRNIRRNKVYSSINIIGLAIGIAGFLLIMLWVQDELSFDSFHQNRDSIYRVVCETKGEPFFGSPAPLGPSIESQIPEVIRSTRLYRMPRFVFAYDRRSFYEENGIVVDPAFFTMFSFPFLQGSVEKGFSNPDHIVITESMARKYFGSDNPIDKKISVEGRGFLVVGGVLKDIPSNSHLQFDYAVPYVFLNYVQLCGLHWSDFNFKTYIQVGKPADPQTVQEKITQVAYRNNCPQVKELGFSFSLQSLKEMYLHPISTYDIQLGDIRYVRIFSVMAVFILAIACVNFINLSTARALTRVKEVSIRKIVGAERWQIVLQLWSEFVLFALMALAIALAAIPWIMPSFRQLTGKELVLDYLHPQTLALVLTALVGCGIIAGLYPAVSISLFQPVQLLERKGIAGSNSTFVRRLLVIGQFSLSILLIVCTLVVSSQMSFIHNKSWNLGNDLVVSMPIKENIGVKFDMVKNKLLQDPNIVAVSAKDALPTTVANNTAGVWWSGKTEMQNGLFIETIRVTHDYFATMGLKIVAGRDFSPEYPGDAGGAFVLNQEAVRLTGLTDPVGKEFSLYGKRGAIIGVAENSYFQTLKQPTRPQAYSLFTNLPGEGYFGSVFVRIAQPRSHADLQAILARIQTVWNSVNSVAPFEYHFLDRTIQDQYQNEERLMLLFSIFAALAIVISCLGLFGLSMFVAERRTKEIGIRKVLGSSVPGIVVLLSRTFVQWVLVANIIAWPIAWFAMNKWLQNFVYRIDLTIWPFLLSGLAALTIALLTVCWQAIRAATADPVESLRNE